MGISALPHWLSAGEKHCRNARPHSKEKNSVPFDTLFSLKAYTRLMQLLPAEQRAFAVSELP